MKIGLKPVLGLLLAGLLSACGQISVSNDCACGFYTISGTEKMLHWRDGSQIHFQIENSFPEQYRFAIDEIALSYNHTLKNTRIIIDETRDSTGHLISKKDAPGFVNGDSTSVNGDGVNGVYWITGEWPWLKSDPKSDAMTVLNFSPEGIIEADVYFKASSFGEPTDSLSQVQKLYSTRTGFAIEDASRDFQWVYTIGLHEFGHALGRVHNHSQSSLMFPSVGLSFVANPFPKEDLETLSTVYAIAPGIL